MRKGPTANGPTATRTARKGEGRPTWELADLIRPLREASRRTVRQPRILPHYPAVVEYVYNSRLATADQIRRRFPGQIRSDRTAQYQMARLIDLGFLATAPVRSTSVHFPRVYLATKKGIGLISDTYARHGVYWHVGPSEERKSRGRAMLTVLHELLLSEFELAVWKNVQNRAGLELLSQERRYFLKQMQLRYQQQGRTRRVEPDAGFLLAHGSGNGRSLMQHFVEMDMGSMSLPRIHRKLKAYAAWSQSEEGRAWLTRTYAHAGSEPPNNLFRLLFVCHDKLRPHGDDARAQNVLSISAELPRAMRKRVWVTSMSELADSDHVTDILSNPVWRKCHGGTEEGSQRMTIA